MDTTVVVGYDRTLPGERALAVAAREADWRSGSLVVISAYQWPVPQDFDRLARADVEAIARKAAEETAAHGAGLIRPRHPGLRIEPRAVAGHPGKVLADASHFADLLVVGNRGIGGFDDLQVGSTSLRTLAGACCPVLVVRGNVLDAHHRIVAAVDIDEGGDRVLDFAFDEAARRGAGLTAIHVWDEPWIISYGELDPEIAEDVTRIERERGDLLAALVRSTAEHHPAVDAFQQVATGSASGLLVQASQHADLLVTGARRHTEGRHGMLLGPVTQTMLQHAACPVTVVPLS